MQKFENRARRSPEAAPVETRSKRPVRSYLDGQIDDERMYTFDYDFDTVELTRIYKELYDSNQWQGWPWTNPDKDDGWHRAGWYYPEINKLREGEKQPWLTIDQYPYLRELAVKFPFKNSAFWYFRNKSWFAFPVHYDSAIKPNGKNYNTEQKIPDAGYGGTSERFSHFPETYFADKMLGSQASLNVLLCKEWAGDENPVPVEFTYDNQAYLVEGDLPRVSMKETEYYKTDLDWRYYYQIALLNTNWTHYCSMDGQYERLLFRWSIYGQTFEEAKAQLKSMGL
jgi:hypothetical protein